MRIAYDHQAFCRQKTGGISRYFCRLAEHLAGKEQTVGVFAPLYRNQYLKTLPAPLVHGYGVRDYPPKSSELMVAANGLLARTLIRGWKPDLVHETYFSAVRARFGTQPTVLTVFDMIGELPEYGATGSGGDIRKSAKYAAVSRADHIICISDHTRQDLIRLFGVAEHKVSVIHLGCDALAPEVYAPSQAQSQTQSKTHSRSQSHAQSHAQGSHIVADRPYLLYVGLRDGYKNFVAMLRAVAASRRLRTSFDIVAFGGGAFSATEQALITRLGFSPGQVRQLAGDDANLARVYKQATAFVYPSTYEGFGLPPIEAMTLKCPVISSHSSCMPEIIGEAAEYFDPEQTDSIASAIENVVFSESRTCELIAKGEQRAQLFTWDRCAENTLSVYRSLGSGYK